MFFFLNYLFGLHAIILLFYSTVFLVLFFGFGGAVYTNIFIVNYKLWVSLFYCLLMSKRTEHSLILASELIYWYLGVVLPCIEVYSLFALDDIQIVNKFYMCDTTGMYTLYVHVLHYTKVYVDI